MADSVRVRFAPSPTGYLHVGGARTALYCYLFAQGHKGEFVLRIEDTDEERSTDESLKLQVEDLSWLGLHWDEGVDPKSLKDQGPYGPYRQSQRLDIYRKHAEELIHKGHAYYCFMKDEEIDSQREQAKEAGTFLQVRSPFRDMSLEEAQLKIAAGETPVVRFKTSDMFKEYVLNDLVRGEVKFPSDMINDFVLLRSSGMPVYNFCCVVDDHLMKMSHVFRAEEHLNNTLRQMMIYEAFGWSLPEFGHMSIILGPDKQKLSKRHGATSIGEYRKQGYLPEAINNYLVLLGWSHPEEKEVMSLQEMAAAFSPHRLHSAPAVFDEAKLKWFNGMHMRQLAKGSDNDKSYIWSCLQPLFTEAGLELPADKEWQSRALETFVPRIETLVDAVELFRPLSLSPMTVSEESKETLSWDTSRTVIEKWKSFVSVRPEEFLSAETFDQLQNQVKEECGVKGKQLFMPIRVAIIGKPHGADLKELVPLMRKEELIRRSDFVLNQL